MKFALLIHCRIIYVSSTFKFINRKQLFFLFMRLLILALLVVSISCSCASTCLTCYNPNHYYYKTFCTSCSSSYFIYQYTCIECTYCSNYNMCGECPASYSSSSSGEGNASPGVNINQLMPVILGSIGGAIAVGGVILCCVRRCRNTQESSSDGPQVSDARLNSTKSETLKWNKS
jgi:hypothetical protein